MHRHLKQKQQFLGFVTFIAVTFAASTAMAQSVGLTVAEVGEKLEAAGLSIEVVSQSDGGVIYAESQGFNFALLAFSCQGAEVRCRDFMFSAFFETDGKVSKEAINEFNQNSLGGRAYIDAQGDANLEHLFTVYDGNDDLVEYNLDIWQSILPDFAGFIGGFGDAPSS